MSSNFICVAFSDFPKDHSAPGIVRLNASHLLNVIINLINSKNH